MGGLIKLRGVIDHGLGPAQFIFQPVQIAEARVLGGQITPQRLRLIDLPQRVMRHGEASGGRSNCPSSVLEQVHR